MANRNAKADQGKTEKNAPADPNPKAHQDDPKEGTPPDPNAVSSDKNPPEESAGRSVPKSMPTELFRNAVEDSQVLLAYAVRKSEKEIDSDTLAELVEAKRRVDSNRDVDAKSEAEFWSAYRNLQQQVRPITLQEARAAEKKDALKSVMALSAEPFEKAVNDAQLLLAYAVSKSKEEIHPDTLTNLIQTKRLIDEEKEMTPVDQANFWLSYRKLQKHVKRVTADSIRAASNETTIAEAMSGKLFEEAVGEAQILLDYASTKCREDIKRDTLEKLTEIRDRVNKKQKITVNEEVDFWLQYQALLKLVKPVTVDTIRETAGQGARLFMIAYIAFTGLVLLALLYFQIYWLIGDRLIGQVDDLSKKQEGNISIPTTGTLAGATDGIPANGQLNLVATNTEAESVRSQLAMQSRVLLAWGRSWYWLMNSQDSGVLSAESNPKYAPLIQDIDRQIDAIDSDIKKATLMAQLSVDQSEDVRQNLKQKIGLFNQKGTLESIMRGVDEKEKKLEAQKKKMAEQKDALKAQISQLNAEKDTVEKKKSEMIGNKSNLEAQLAGLGLQISDLENQLMQLNPTAIPVAAITQAGKVANPATGVKGTPVPTQTLTPAAALDPTAEAETQTKKEDFQGQLNTITSNKAGIAAQIAQIQDQLPGFDNRLAEISTNLVSLTEQITQIDNQLKDVSAPEGEQNQLTNLLTAENLDGTAVQAEIARMIDEEDTLGNQLAGLGAVKTAIAGQIVNIGFQIESLPEVAVQPGVVVNDTQLQKERAQKVDERERLEALAIEDTRLETVIDNARPALLVGKFVLDILQGYILPLLYGILGAGTFALRTLSKEIEQEIFSRRRATQHILRMALGALAGIMVGFLLPKGTTFLGAISPLAIAFLVGYNIEIFFSLMDSFIDSIKKRPTEKAG